MTREEIIEGNLLIAKFMGGYESETHSTIIEGLNGGEFHVEDLEYHKDWNWIMPAWKTFYFDVINTEWYAEFCDDESDVCFGCLRNGLETGNIENIFKYFVRLIEWYGETKRIDLSPLAGTYDSKGVEDVLKKMKQTVYNNTPLGNVTEINDTGGCLMPDWNSYTLDQMATYLKEEYKYSSTGTAKCVYHLVEFYEKNKPK